MPGKSSEDFQEKTRMCPTCRMEISFFATKCRFCGEPVGRPKEEVRQLTVRDLGGESGSHYAPNENVSDALEQFRQEEMARLEREEEPQSWFRRKKDKKKTKTPGPGPVSPYNELPGLDPSTRDLASIGGFNRRRHAARENVFTKKLAMLGGFVAALLILYFGGGFVKAKYDDYIARRNQAPAISVDNQAMAILDAGGSPIEALDAAIDALNTVQNAENIEVANTVRAVLLERIEELLNRVPFDQTNLNKASNMASRAVQIDPNTPALRKAREEVTKEVFAYRMSIQELDAQAGTVTLRVMYPDNRPDDLVIKRRGETVLSRFEIKSIMRDGVRFSDSMRKTRAGLDREFKIYTDGSIRAT